ATQARRRLDGAASSRGNPWRGPGLRMHWPCAGGVQPVQARRDRGRASGQVAAVPGEGVGGGWPNGSRTGSRYGRGKGTERSRGSRRGGRASDGSLPLDASNDQRSIEDGERG